MKWIYHKVRLNYFIIECVDTWLLRGISEQNVDDWGLAKGQQTPSMNASEQSCSNIKCDAIFMLQFLEIKSTAWLRSVSFIHIRFEKIKTCICWFFVQRSKVWNTMRRMDGYSFHEVTFLTELHYGEIAYFGAYQMMTSSWNRPPS